MLKCSYPEVSFMAQLGSGLRGEAQTPVGPVSALNELAIG